MHTCLYNYPPTFTDEVSQPLHNVLQLSEVPDSEQSVLVRVDVGPGDLLKLVLVRLVAHTQGDHHDPIHLCQAANHRVSDQPQSERHRDCHLSQSEKHKDCHDNQSEKHKDCHDNQKSSCCCCSESLWESPSIIIHLYIDKCIPQGERMACVVI